MGHEAIFCEDLATNEANYVEGALLLHLIMQVNIILSNFRD